jgi:two-component system OmpR family sensor kinase
MHSLNIKLGLSLLLIVVISVGTMALVTRAVSQYEFERYRVRCNMEAGQSPGGMMGQPDADQAGADEYLSRLGNSIWLAGLASAAAALVVGMLLTRQITHPVRELAQGTNRLAGGDFKSRVKIKSRDEIGQLAASFNTMAASLERGEQSRRQLTADIAHELRTPLTVIEGTVDGILDGVFEPNREHLLSIKDQTRMLTRLISDLRDLSLAESGQLKLNRVSTDVSEMARRLAAGYEMQAAEKNLRLKVEAGAAVPEVMVDPLRIEQVISNLLTNAMRHTPAGGSININVSRDSNNLVISVADTGEGIKADDLPHIFERFYRSGSARARKDGGTGLGLAIVKQMVEAHGGRVWVESRPGSGSRFGFSIPLGGA